MVIQVNVTADYIDVEVRNPNSAADTPPVQKFPILPIHEILDALFDAGPLQFKLSMFGTKDDNTQATSICSN